MAIVQRVQPSNEAQADPRSIIGHNRPPLDIEARADFDEAINQREGFRKRVDDLLSGASRAQAVDNDTAGRCGELVNQIRAAIKVIDDTHTTVKAPYLAAGRAVDAAKNEMRGPLDDAKRRVEAKQSEFLTEQENLRRAEARRQQIIAQEAAEEERRKEQQRLAAERAANPEVVPEPAPEPEPVYVAPTPEPEREIIRGDFGAAVSAKKVWRSRVTDYTVAFMAVDNNEKVREAIDKAIQNLVNGGVRKIEGVDVVEVIKASNRGG